MLCLWQGWEFALSLICSSIFRSKLLILKSNCEQFTHVAHYKRATVSDLLRLLITKERPWSIHSRWSLQKSNREQFAKVAHDKRAARVNCSFSWANCSFVLLLTKTTESLEKPMSKFPTLLGAPENRVPLNKYMKTGFSWCHWKQGSRGELVVGSRSSISKS